MRNVCVWHQIAFLAAQRMDNKIKKFLLNQIILAFHIGFGLLSWPLQQYKIGIHLRSIINIRMMMIQYNVHFDDTTPRIVVLGGKNLDKTKLYYVTKIWSSKWFHNYTESLISISAPYMSNSNCIKNQKIKMCKKPDIIPR